MAGRFLSDASRFEKAMKVAQAKSALSGLFLSLAMNSFIAISLAALLVLDRPSRPVLYWLIGVLVINAVRFAYVIGIRRRETLKRNPQLVLNFLALGALMSGICWSIVPLALSNIAESHDSYVIFIITGITAGTLIQDAAYAIAALAFLTPPLFALDTIMLFSGTSTGFLIGANAVVLTVIIVRNTFEAERQFLARTRSALEARALAKSLFNANAHIVDSNKQLEVLARQDALTGLANRASFNEALNARLSDLCGDAELALVLFDLDRFKAVNDTYGHRAGDKLLLAFTRKLRTLSEPEDLLARLGGDEFAAVICGKGATERSRLFATKVVEGFRDPVIDGGLQTRSGASAGVSFAPEHAREPDGLFAAADMALYDAKERGRRLVSVFNSTLRERLNRQRLIEATLPAAIANGDVRAVFQPQVSLINGDVIGFETLMRWYDPVLGHVNPQEIGEVAANAHMGHHVTRFMLIKACEFLRAIEDAGRLDIPVAVNISPREFANVSPADMFIEVAAEYNIDPDRIEIEITEETLFDTKSSNHQLVRLKKAGFKIAVDDFGMGHSSLSYLIDMRIDRLKIDRNFITGIAHNPHNQALVTALLTLGKALDLAILVEGVETREEAEKLIELGCDQAQGFLFSKALTPADAALWLAQRELLGKDVIKLGAAKRIA